MTTPDKDRLYLYFQGRLKEGSADFIRQKLEVSEEFKRSFSRDQKVFGALDALKREQQAPSEQFSSKVLQSVSKVSLKRKWRLSMFKREDFGSWNFFGRLTAAAAACFVILLICSLYQTPPAHHTHTAIYGNGYQYSDTRISSTTIAVLTYLEGSFGALIMVIAGVASIICAVASKFRASAGFCAVAFAFFVSRSMTATFFNDTTISDHGYRQSNGYAYNDVRIASGMPAIVPWLFGSSSNSQSSVPYQPVIPQQQQFGSYNEAPEPSYAQSSNERYGEYAENPRIQVTNDPISTFSIDVDTASYTNMRRYVRQGALPPKTSVRIEEYLNYFDYDCDVANDKPFGICSEIAPSPFDSGRYLLKLGVKARSAPQDNERGWNLVFLVDVSGSMNEPDKLPLVKKSLELLTKQMRPVDQIAIVVYAGNAGLVLDSTYGNNREQILAAINNLSAGGSTNGGEGINLAYQIAREHFMSGSVNRVILATDGDFNVGVTSFDSLINLVEEKRKSGITLTTLGFGQGNINDQNMEQLADHGNGNYFYIDSFREARKVLERQLTSNIEVVAKDVKLQLEFNSSHVAQYRLIGFDNRRLNREDFTNDAKDAGEIGSGHTVTALYEITLADSDLARDKIPALRYSDTLRKENTPVPSKFPDELGMLRLRYKEPAGEKSSQLDFPLLASSIKKDPSQASTDFRFAAAVAHFAQLLRQSQFLGTYNWGDVLAVAREGKGEDKFGQRDEFIRLVMDAMAIGR